MRFLLKQCYRFFYIKIESAVAVAKIFSNKGGYYCHSKDVTSIISIVNLDLLPL